MPFMKQACQEHIVVINLHIINLTVRSTTSWFPKECGEKFEMSHLCLITDQCV